MIINLLLNVVVLILGAVFSWLPQVQTLPYIVDFDIDTALVQGVGQLKTFLNAFWPIEIMFQGFLFLMGYFAIKMVLKFFLGGRAPAN
jgi:hypothetical protein